MNSLNMLASELVNNSADFDATIFQNSSEIALQNARYKYNINIVLLLSAVINTFH